MAWIKFYLVGMFGLPPRERRRRMTVYHFDNSGVPDVARYWDEK